jgi:hypothetical protein
MRFSLKTPSLTNTSYVSTQKKRAHSVALGSGGIPEPAELIAVKLRMTAASSMPSLRRSRPVVEFIMYGIVYAVLSCSPF